MAPGLNVVPHPLAKWQAGGTLVKTSRWFSAGAATVWLALAAVAMAQTQPDAGLMVHRPELRDMQCPAPQALVGATSAEATPLSEAQLARREQRRAYRELLFIYLSHLPPEPDQALLMPVDGVRVSQVADTYGAPRGGGRGHQGQDIFAARGTPVRSATHGIVYEVSDRFTGGRGVMIFGPGSVRYFYTHLESFAVDLREGMPVTPDTVIGYVGNDGNAATTPPHLHFGSYAFEDSSCRLRAFDPLPLLTDR